MTNCRRKKARYIVAGFFVISYLPASKETLTVMDGGNAVNAWTQLTATLR